MSKKKTRKEKVIAELRRKLSHVEVTANNTTKVSPQYFSTIQSSSQTTSMAHPYFYSDLLKTLFVTTAILIFQITLFLAIKHNFINL